MTALRGATILDAGAGTGAIQWWLAAKGATVVSVDREDRSRLAASFRRWCRVEGLRKVDVLPPSFPTRMRTAAGRLWNRLRPGSPLESTGGRVVFYNQDLRDLCDIPDGHVDTVVSISAFEHNTLEGMHMVVEEMMRVLKPGGAMLATIAGARDTDWFHEPSKGWCLTEKTIRDIFRLRDCPTNFSDYDTIFSDLQNCDFLKGRLSKAYFESGDNGMPWGVWNPAYQPVGLVKVKR